METEIDVIQDNITVEISENNFTVEVEGGSGIGSTDELPEGVTNKYFTDERSFDSIASILEEGTNITLDVNDTTNKITINASGGGGGAVDSVNGQTGVVVLDTDDISEGNNKYFDQNLVIALATVL